MLVKEALARDQQDMQSSSLRSGDFCLELLGYLKAGKAHTSAVLTKSSFYMLKGGWGKEGTKNLTLQKDISILNEWERNMDRIQHRQV